MAANTLAKASDEEFAQVWDRLGGNAEEVKKYFGYRTTRRVLARRREAENGLGRSLTVGNTIQRTRTEVAQRAERTVTDGVVMAFSDAHFWRMSMRSLCVDAFLILAKRLKPVGVVANGDVIDGSTTSRHHRLGWENRPTLAEEIFTSQNRLSEIDKATPGAWKHWNYGNHDNRLDGWLANKVPEVEGLPMSRLQDHFPKWEMSYSLHLNAGGPGYTVIKHRYKGGKYADANNVLNAGTHMVTGHDHMLNVFNWGDYTGRKWGVRTGQFSEPYGPQFLYAEDNPRAWNEGFAVLTFIDGELLPPELCYVIKGRAIFRGEVIAERK